MPQSSVVDLSKLSIPELKSLKDKIDSEIQIRRQKEKSDAVRQIHEIADKSGFSLDELVGGKSGRKKGGKAPVKYRDPEDPTKTWAGRGRKPRWLEQALREGKNLEDYAV